MDLKSFGDKVREVRKTRNMTGEALAEKCNMSPSFLRQIEAGKKGVSVENLIRLCNSLNVSPGYLLQAELNTLYDTVVTNAELIRYLEGLDEEEVRDYLRVIKLCMI